MFGRRKKLYAIFLQLSHSSAHTSHQCNVLACACGASALSSGRRKKEIVCYNFAAILQFSTHSGGDSIPFYGLA